MTIVLIMLFIYILNVATTSGPPALPAVFPNLFKFAWEDAYHPHPTILQPPIHPHLLHSLLHPLSLRHQISTEFSTSSSTEARKGKHIIASVTVSEFSACLWDGSQTLLHFCPWISFRQEQLWVKNFEGSLVSLLLHWGPCLTIGVGVFKLCLPTVRHLI